MAQLLPVGYSVETGRPGKQDNYLKTEDVCLKIEIHEESVQ